LNIKDKAAHVKRLQEDESFNTLIDEIREDTANVFLNPDTANVFLNPHSSTEDREEAHHIIRALAKIEDRMAVILTDEAIFDRQQRRSVPWKRLMN
jgi:hypothetical protein